MNVLCKTYIKDLENQTLNRFPNSTWKVENASVIRRSFCLLFIWFFHFHWNVFLYYGASISVVLLIPEWLNAGHVLYFYPSFCLSHFLGVHQICLTPFHLYSACFSPLTFLLLLFCGISVVIFLKKLLPIKKKKKKNYKSWAMLKCTKKVIFPGFLCPA